MNHYIHHVLNGILIFDISPEYTDKSNLMPRSNKS